MKHTKRILALLAAATLAVSAWAQTADDDYQRVNDHLTQLAKNTKPDAATLQQTSKEVVACLAAYPGDKRATGLVDVTLGYGEKLQAAKNPVLAQSWYTSIEGEILDKQIEPGVTPEAKDAMTALVAAMSEGEMRLTPNPENLKAWREKLNALLAAPAGVPFVLAREKAFYGVIASMPAYKKVANDQLAQLSQHKDNNISGWAQQELKYNVIRQAPFTLSVTTLDGKKFDTAALKGTPYLYLYFWSIDAKNQASELKKLADATANYSGKQLTVLAVCCDPEEKRADVTAFIKKNKVPFPVYFDGKGRQSDLCEKFGVTKTPIGFIFDRKGAMGPADFKYGDFKKTIK